MIVKLIRTLYFVFSIRLVTVQVPGLLDSWFLIIMQLLCYMIGECFDWDCDAVPLPVSGQHSIQAIMCSLIVSCTHKDFLIYLRLSSNQGQEKSFETLIHSLTDAICYLFSLMMLGKNILAYVLNRSLYIF